ncbi:signal peptidase I SipW [Evansella halocellulosilytica]|uniref:signal peptidase I SipW n=1 Tax=Evansella halocellulosilytica TaxID=2011013 RepID=UPI000BB8AC6F|nr:signal peptidase I [Evansella halocellulosilytica]
MKLKTVKKWVSALVSFTLFTSLILMAFVVISTKASGGEPELFGYQLKTVLSGSMEPEFKTGSIIAVKPDGDMTRFTEGDIITFMENEERLVTHRVIDVVYSGDNVMYETKGDSNNAPDSSLVLSENVVAEYTGFTIPYIGYMASFAQSKEGGALMLIVPGIILLIYAGFTIWQGLSQMEKENQSTNNSANIEEVKESV